MLSQQAWSHEHELKKTISFQTSTYQRTGKSTRKIVFLTCCKTIIRDTLGLTTRKVTSDSSVILFLPTRVVAIIRIETSEISDSNSLLYCCVVPENRNRDETLHTKFDLLITICVCKLPRRLVGCHGQIMADWLDSHQRHHFACR